MLANVLSWDPALSEVVLWRALAMDRVPRMKNAALMAVDAHVRSPQPVVEVCIQDNVPL